MIIRRKQKTDKQIKKEIERKEEAGRMKFFYDLIWSGLKEKKCQQCGCNLGREWKSWMFDHLLEKAQYPEVMYEMWNIFICCFQCHGKKSQGFPGDKHKAAIEQAMEKYKKLKEGNSDTEQ